MPSQHGAKLWTHQEAKELSRKFVKLMKDDAVPLIPANSKKAPIRSPPLAGNPIIMGTMVPDTLQKGATMLKFANARRNRLFVRILNKSSEVVTGTYVL